jgi:two-component system chemotaxis response regulator CheB
MKNSKHSVLIVDDQRINIMEISNALRPDCIIFAAGNGPDALEVAHQKPDIILLDIEMPVMNGLQALKQIMATQPTAVLMFSSLTKEGSQETIEALSSGAVDFIPKDSSYFDVSSVKDELIKKITELGSDKYLKRMFKTKYPVASTTAPTETTPKKILETKTVIPTGSAIKPHYLTSKFRPSPNDIKVICIGISTGGPVALQEVIPSLPANYPVPILIVQHMPPHFTESLARRLDSTSKITVVEASDGMSVKPGYAYIAKGGFQMTITKQHTISINSNFPTELFKPSVNVMLNSVVEVYNDRAVGIIMTGMGNDGQQGLAALNKQGGYVIAQEPESCVVAGMPRSVIDNKIAHEIQPLSSIAGSMIALFAAK